MGIEIIRLNVEEPDIYRAFIPDVGLVMNKNEIKKLIKVKGLKVKKILEVEAAEERFGNYIYFKGCENLDNVHRI